MQGTVSWLAQRDIVRRVMFPFSSRSARQAAFGVTLAILISYNASLTLGFGLLGSQGNSIATGLLLFGLPLLLFLFSFRSDLRIQLPDIAFAGLLIVVLLSFFINPFEASSTKEYLLLVASLAGYIACRPMLAEDAAIVRSVFERITAVIVLVGAVFTAAEIFNQWDGPPGKPFVFGFNAAGTYFMTSLGFLVIAFVTVDKPRPKRTAVISALIFFPATIFAAAMVRFTFIALAGSLFVAMILAERGKRWHVVAVAVTILLAIAAGMSARYSTAKIYTAYILEETVETSIAKKPAEILQEADEVPSCRLKINTRNSIAIRQGLARDAIYLIPTVGLVGTGLDSFMRFSCIQGHQVHISIMQAAVEFGWLGGVFFVLLIGAALYRLLPLAKDNGAIRFIFCSLVFVVLLSLAHGRVSRDAALFALLGCAVGICDFRRSSNETAPTWD
jgi:O-antigen ligase